MTLILPLTMWKRGLPALLLAVCLQRQENQLNGEQGGLQSLHSFSVNFLRANSSFT